MQVAGTPMKMWSGPQENDMTDYDTRHGGAYDRGGADAYYGRAFDPHYYVGSSEKSLRIKIDDPDSEDWKAYAAGFRDTVEAGDFKDWG